MTNTFTNGAAFPVTISQIQRIAQTLQKRMQPSREIFPEVAALPAAPAIWGEGSKVFSDRQGAGAMLASQLTTWAGRNDVSVVGLSPGGMVVASEVARQLQAPLSPWVVKKLRARLLFAATLGAVAEDGELLIDEEAFARLHVPPTMLVEEVRASRGEVKRRLELFRTVQPPVELAGRTVIVVDDGAGSGFTIRAALLGLRRQRPARLLLALPVVSTELLREFSTSVQGTIALETTLEATPISQRYVHFPKVSSEEVVTLLQQAGSLKASPRTSLVPTFGRQSGAFQS